MSIGSSPPSTPPQLSPDGKWVWDGTQWQPVPVVIGDLAGVVPVVPAAAAPAHAPAVVQYAPSQAQAPVIYPSAQAQSPALPYAVPEPAVVPLWEQQRAPSPLGGKSVYLFAGAAFVVLIMAMMALNSLNIVRLPWQSDGQVPSRPTVTPPPQLQTRTEFARAENFLKYSLAPVLVTFGENVTTFSQQCSGAMTISCNDALITTDNQMVKVLAVVDNGNIPPCIAGPVARMRIDLANMQGALRLAITGFKENKAATFHAGLSQFGSQGPAFQTDAKAADQALKTVCNTQLAGP